MGHAERQNVTRGLDAFALEGVSKEQGKKYNSSVVRIHVEGNLRLVLVFLDQECGKSAFGGG